MKAIVTFRDDAGGVAMDVTFAEGKFDANSHAHQFARVMLRNFDEQMRKSGALVSDSAEVTGVPV